MGVKWLIHSKWSANIDVYPKRLHTTCWYFMLEMCTFRRMTTKELENVLGNTLLPFRFAIILPKDSELDIPRMCLLNESRRSVDIFSPIVHLISPNKYFGLGRFSRNPGTRTIITIIIVINTIVLVVGVVTMINMVTDKFVICHWRHNGRQMMSSIYCVGLELECLELG